MAATTGVADNQTKALQVKRKLVILIALVLSACSPTRGCMESHFKLAADSRLPKWVELPSDLKRDDVTVWLEYWHHPFRNTASIKVQDKSGRQRLYLTGEVEGGWGHGSRSVHYKLTINGVTELIEHRHRVGGDVYITDDPDLRRKYHLQ
jgi:hypothetical protein